MSEKTYRITIVWPDSVRETTYPLTFSPLETYEGCTIDTAECNAISFRDKTGIKHVTTLPFKVTEERVGRKP